MRQKYIISRDGPESKLTIKEYAITETKVKKPASLTLQNEKYTFLFEETYESQLISHSISNGSRALVTVLRTNNLYPIDPYITKIAETVISVFNSGENEPVELFFNDLDLVSIDTDTV